MLELAGRTVTIDAMGCQREVALNKLKRWQIKKENGKVMPAGIRLKQQACGWSRNFLLQALLTSMRLPE